MGSRRKTGSGGDDSSLGRTRPRKGKIKERKKDWSGKRRGGVPKKERF